jgi:hypothetical protein
VLDDQARIGQGPIQTAVNELLPVGQAGCVDLAVEDAVAAIDDAPRIAK